MPNNNTSIDGIGKFQQSTENAGVIKYGEFSQVSINTGNIAVSALFTGSAVNSGTIGNYLPFSTAVLVQTNSANWDAAFAAMGNYVLNTDGRLTDARVPLAHTQAISTIDGLAVALATLEAQAGAISVTTADITDFTTAVDAMISSAAGTTVASLVNGLVPASQLPSYVDDVLEYSALASFPGTGETGKIYVDTTSKKIYRWSGSTYIEISPSPGSTDSVTEGSTNLYFTNARASAAAPVQSVAGKTGTVTLSTSDIQGLNAAIALASSVLSVAGKTGAVVLSTSDIQGLQAALDGKQAAGSYATTTAVDALSSAIDGKQAAGSYAAAVHTHVIADVTGLQTALDGKQAAGSYATTTAVAALSSAIDGKQASGSYATLTITNALSSAIDGKQAAGSYAAAVHTHSTSDITGFNAAASAAAPVQSVAGKTGTVTLSTSDIQGFNANAAAQAPVQSVAGRTGAVVVSASDVAGFNTAADARIAAAAGVSVASLVGGFVPSAQLPSYVDDVLEYSALASFPGTGETGKIYVDTTSKKIYRWSGSAYVEIAPSPGSTDSVTEGSTNLYFTNARASAAAPVQSVAGKTGAVTLSTSDIQGLAATIATIPSSAQTTDWNNVSTVYKAASASYLTSTNFTTVTATSLTLGTAMLSTYTSPVTASGDFLVFTVGGKQRLIRVWDFI